MTNPAVASFHRYELPWGRLEPGMYVVDREVRLWQLIESRDGAWLVEGAREERVIWPAMDPATPVPVAELYPADPLALLRERLGASMIAFKPNAAGEWVAAPWRPQKPGNEPLAVYVCHFVEMHGLRPPPGLSYDELRAYHAEHHQPGVAHIVKHTHPEL